MVCTKLTVEGSLTHKKPHDEGAEVRRENKDKELGKHPEGEGLKTLSSRLQPSMLSLS